MKPIDANAAAFPSFPKELGLTKREYFAAMAMQGILANPGLVDKDERIDSPLSRAAVHFADKLIAALGGEK